MTHTSLDHSELVQSTRPCGQPAIFVMDPYNKDKVLIRPY